MNILKLGQLAGEEIAKKAKDLVKTYNIPFEEAITIVKSETKDIPRKRIKGEIAPEIIPGVAKGPTIGAEYDTKLVDKLRVKDKAPTAEKVGLSGKDFLKPGAMVTGAGGLAAATYPSVDGVKTDAKPFAAKEDLKTPENKDKETDTTSTETKTTKPKEQFKYKTISLGDSEEAKEYEKQINTNLDTLSKLNDPEVTSRLDRDQAIKDLKEARKSRANTLEWAKVFEKLVAAVTKYGAAKQGLNRGLDMSRAEIERTDWDKMIDRAFNTYESEYKDLLNVYGREDKEKADVDTKRTSLTKEIADIRGKIGRAKDITARENARFEQRKQELMGRAADKKEDREVKERIAKEKIDLRQEPQFFSMITDDPDTFKELQNAFAIEGEEGLKKALGRSAVQDKLKREGLTPFMEKTGLFGLYGDKEVSPEKLGKHLAEDQDQAPDTKTQAPTIPIGTTKVAKNGKEYRYIGNNQWELAK